MIDDRKIYELRLNSYAFPTIGIAQEVKLFECLALSPKTIETVADELHLTLRATEAMMIVASALGFLKKYSENHYTLTEVARTYLLPSGPFYYGQLIESHYSIVKELRPALTKSSENFDSSERYYLHGFSDEQLNHFIHHMDIITAPAAVALSNQTIFKSMHTLLDVAGGSGSLCIALAKQCPQLRSTIMELERVGQRTQQNIKRNKLTDRIAVQATDMFKDPWPVNYDGVLFGNVFHDWDLKSLQHLTRQAFTTLKPGGTICLHEMLLNASKTGPLPIACFSISMLLYEQGKQYTAKELQLLLEQAGFIDFQTIPTFGYYSLTTAKKPLA